MYCTLQGNKSSWNVPLKKLRQIYFVLTFNKGCKFQWSFCHEKWTKFIKIFDIEQVRFFRRSFTILKNNWSFNRESLFKKCLFSLSIFFCFFLFFLTHLDSRLLLLFLSNAKMNSGLSWLTNIKGAPMQNFGGSSTTKAEEKRGK